MAAVFPDCYAKFFGHPLIAKSLRGGGRLRWSAKCPAHDDEHSSLSIDVGLQGKLLVKCHAPHGCSFDGIVRALSLSETDFFPPSEKRTMSEGRKFATSYDYRDETGELLFQCVRMEPKSFYQRRRNRQYDAKLPRDRDKNPEFINDLEGVRLVPYRLNELLAAIKEEPKRAVLLCEGEKDCDLLWSIGIVATCNPMGALKWRKEYSAFLKGCNVIIIPDEDPVDATVGFAAGLKHAEEIAESLRGIAGTIRVLRLPVEKPKDDVSSWWLQESIRKVQPDQRKQNLIDMARHAPEWTGTMPPPHPDCWRAGEQPLQPAKPAPASASPLAEWDGSLSEVENAVIMGGRVLKFVDRDAWAGAVALHTLTVQTALVTGVALDAACRELAALLLAEPR